MDLDLDSMSAMDKQALYERLAFDLRDQAPKPDEAQQTLWNDINDALEIPKGGRRSLGSFLEVPGNRGRMTMAVEQSDGLLIRALPARCDRRVRMHVRHMMLTCLIDYVKAIGVPPTPTTVLMHFEKMRAAVGRAFPGYIEAQMLHQIVRVAVPAD